MSLAKIGDPSSTDTSGLCDWAEMRALVSARRTCTLGDIEKYIRPDDTVLEVDQADYAPDSDIDEGIAADVLGVASKRSFALDSAYPFEITHRAIRLKPSAESELTGSQCTYVFCLALSALDSNCVPLLARDLFETEAKHLLGPFLGGEAFHFGWSANSDAQGKILKRVEAFCTTARLGWKPHPTPRASRQRNDAGIDLIFWKRVPDERENALVFLAQCASGHNWEQKLTSRADRLFAEYLQYQPSAPIHLCFCTPFHIVKGWDEAALNVSGLLFDRIRLVLLSRHATSKQGVSDARTRKWLAGTLEQLRDSSPRSKTRALGRRRLSR